MRADPWKSFDQQLPQLNDVSHASMECLELEVWSFSGVWSLEFGILAWNFHSSARIKTVSSSPPAPPPPESCCIHWRGRTDPVSPAFPHADAILSLICKSVSKWLRLPRPLPQFHHPAARVRHP